MKINLQNVASILEANVVCDGLTVITGKNGSGKSSFEKAITSVFLSLEGCEKQFLIDRINFVYKTIIKALGSEDFYLKYIIEQGDVNDKNFPALKYLFTKKNYIEDVTKLRQLLNDIRYEIDSNKEMLYLFNLRLFSLRRYELNKEEEQYFLSRKEKASLEIYNRVRPAIDELRNYIDFENSEKTYINNRVTKQFDLSFNGQVKPFFPPHGETRVIIEDSTSLLKFEYRDSGKGVFDGDIDCRTNVFYISDTAIIDDIKQIEKHIKSPESFYDDSNNTSVISFKNKLLNNILSNGNLAESDAIRFKYPRVFEIVDSIINYNIMIKKDGLYTTNGGISVSNEASGAKIFIILKMLLERGKIDSETLIFFDEPENHLHPSWQEELGKLFSMMSADIGCKIVISTHSPTFLLSLDTFSTELKQKGQFKVYYCEKIDNRSIVKDLTNNIRLAHGKLNESFIEMGLFGNK